MCILMILGFYIHLCLCMCDHKAWGLFPLMIAYNSNMFNILPWDKLVVAAGHPLRSEALTAASMQCLPPSLSAQCRQMAACHWLSQCAADINQAHLTCCLTYCSRWHVYLRGGAVGFISSTHLQDCHQPFMFFSFAWMAACCSMAVMQPFVMAYYLLDVILQRRKCRAAHCSKSEIQ